MYLYMYMYIFVLTLAQAAGTAALRTGSLWSVARALENKLLLSRGMLFGSSCCCANA